MHWFELFIQQTINGITRGSIFALIALGYTMVYGIIELINFAHGDIFMLGLMVSLTLLVDLGLTRTFEGWELVIYLPLIVLGTMVITGLINVAVDRIAYRPLRRAPRLVPLISAIGVSFMLENLTLVNVNHSPAEELRGVLGISGDVAEAIIARREHQPFTDLAQLREIKGIDPNILEQRKSRILF